MHVCKSAKFCDLFYDFYTINMNNTLFKKSVPSIKDPLFFPKLIIGLQDSYLTFFSWNEKRLLVDNLRSIFILGGGKECGCS